MKTVFYSHCNVSIRFLMAANSLSRSERQILDLFCFRMSEKNLIQLNETTLRKISKWARDVFGLDYSSSTYHNTISSLKKKFILISYQPTVYFVNPIFFCHNSKDFKQAAELITDMEMKKINFFDKLMEQYPGILKPELNVVPYTDVDGVNIVEKEGLVN